MPPTDALQAAVERFYEALDALLVRHDPRPMLLVWKLAPGSAALTADGSCGFGRRGLREFAEGWAEVIRDGRITPHDLHFHHLGATAVVTGRERGRGLIGDAEVEVDSRMTLVLHREVEEWRVVHYHVDFAPEVHNAVLLVMAGTAGAVG